MRGSNRPSHILTQNDFLIRSREVHGDRYGYLLSDYKGAGKKVWILCFLHGGFEQSPAKHWFGQGCPECSIEEKRGRPKKQWTFKEFYERASIVHSEKFQYIENSFTNISKPITIICPEHKGFSQKASEHLNGYGCAKCSSNIPDTYKSFCEKANKKHNEFYNYNNFIYVNSKTKGIIDCPMHGPFEQMPYAHLSGAGCIECGGTFPLTQDDFLRRATEKHGNTFDYTKFIYKTYHTKGLVICKIHGPFLIKPAKHLGRGDGCPKCGGTYGSSWGEGKWLDNFNNPNILRNRGFKIGMKYIRPDGFDSTTNTIYEYNGDFWHGNPKMYNQEEVNPEAQRTFGELYQKTLAREKLIKEAGYNLVSIWESDFLASQKKTKP